MIPTQQQSDFEARVLRAPDARAIYDAAKSARAGESEPLITLSAALVHSAFAAPEAATSVYGALRDGWLDRPRPVDVLRVEPAPLSREFWTAFWQLHADRAAGILDAVAITSRIAGLGAFVDPSLLPRAEAIAAGHPKAAEPASRKPPPRLTLDELARQPKDSLAHDFWRLIVDNKFDLEVLDRETMNLALLPPALCYLNTRILQMHDIWHLVGGFHTTVLHEIAISAFQQAQFGHGYSAMFLAVVASGATLQGGFGAPVVFETIAEASQYGCDSPSFMAIEWEKEWRAPLHDVRARHGISAFHGSFAPDYFERLLASA